MLSQLKGSSGSRAMCDMRTMLGSEKGGDGSRLRESLRNMISRNDIMFLRCVISSCTHI
jgi:hypothetical protein